MHYKYIMSLFLLGAPISVVDASDLRTVLQPLVAITGDNVDSVADKNIIVQVLNDMHSLLKITSLDAIDLLHDCCNSDILHACKVCAPLVALKDETINDNSIMQADDYQELKISAEKRSTYCDSTFIYQASFGSSGQTPYVINNPGVYKLAEDIAFNPGAIGATAIIINSSDVTLDLQCFTIALGDSSVGTNAISINAGITDIEITGGRIQNFNTLFSKAVNINANCSRFYIHDISCINVANSITLNTDSEGVIENMGITASPTLVTGISMNSCTDVVVRNIAMNQNGSVTSSLTSVLLSSCTRCIFRDIEIQGNSSTNSFMVFNVAGTSFSTFKNISIINNQTVNIFTGFNFQGAGGCDGNELYNCIVANNQTSGATGYLYGFVIGVGSDDNLLQECEAYRNSTLGTDGGSALVRAFYINSNTRNTLRNCIARDNTAPNTTIALPNLGAVGFMVDAANNAFLKGCVAEDQNAGASLNAAGFYITNGSNNVLHGCQSYRQDFGYRLDPELSTAHIFVKNIAAKNTTNYSQFPAGSNQIAPDITAINASLTVPWTNIGIN